MTGPADIKQVIRASYAARKAGDIDGTLKDFADNGVFTLNANGLGAGGAVRGKAAVTVAVEALIKDWNFDTWEEKCLLVEGNKAALHWRAQITNNTTGKHAVMDVFDLITVEDGKIVDFHQNIDTAMLMSLAAAR